MFTRFNSIVRSTVLSRYYFNSKSFYYRPSSVTTINHTTNLFVHSLRSFCSQNSDEQFELGIKYFKNAMKNYTETVFSSDLTPSEILEKFGIFPDFKVETHQEVMEIMEKVDSNKRQELETQ